MNTVSFGPSIEVAHEATTPDGRELVESGIDVKECRVALDYSVSDHAPLTVHVDSIMSIIRMAEFCPEFASLAIKGRNLDDPKDLIAFDNDPVIQTMLTSRQWRAADFRTMGKYADDIAIDASHRATDDGVSEYPCRYYGLSTMVDQIIASSTTGNHLIPILGGTSVIVLVDRGEAVSDDVLAGWGKGIRDTLISEHNA